MSKTESKFIVAPNYLAIVAGFDCIEITARKLHLIREGKRVLSINKPTNFVETENFVDMIYFIIFKINHDPLNYFYISTTKQIFNIDKRYSITAEYNGSKTVMYILRFCGDYIFSADNVLTAKQNALKHSMKRLSTYVINSGE